MPKDVQMPDGKVIRFPDDMDDATIHAEGLKYVQSKQPKLQTGSGMLTGTGISPERPAVSPDKTNFIIDMLRPLLASAAGGAGATVGGPVGAAVGYGGTDAILQHLKTKADNGMVASATGMEPGGIPATLTNTAEQWGLGKMGEGILKRGTNVIKAIRNVDQPELMKLAPTTAQALEGSGYSKLAHVTKAAEDLALGNKNRALDRTAGKGFSEALDLAKRQELTAFENPQEALGAIQGQMPLAEGSKVPVKFTDQGRPVTPITIKPKPSEPWTVQMEDPYARTVTRTKVNLNEGQTEIIPRETKTLPGGKVQAQYGEPNVSTGAESFAALDKVLADPNKLQATLSRAAELGTGDNLRRSLAGYKFMDIMNKASARDVSGNVTRLNAKTIADEWAAPEMQESFSKLFSNKNKADIDQFFKNVITTQDKPSANTYRKLWLLEGGVGLATNFFTGSPIKGAGGMAGVYIGSQALSRLLTNPKVARIAVALAGGEPLGVPDQLAGRLLTRALQGSTVALINADGSKTPGTFGPQGFEASGR